MKRIGFYIFTLVISIVMISPVVMSYTITDEDKDGVVEIGETITFTGDDFIIESDGDVHIFTQWAWDFDGDFIIDAYGKEVTYTFDSVGYYRGYLYEYGDVGYGFTMEIEVFINGDYFSKNDNQATGWLKNGEPGKGNHYGITGK